MTLYNLRRCVRLSRIISLITCSTAHEYDILHCLDYTNSTKEPPIGQSHSNPALLVPLLTLLLQPVSCIARLWLPLTLALGVQASLCYLHYGT
jgi:hypothetical protein